MEYPFVTMDQVVANSATLIQDTDPKNRNIFKQWTYLAERQLGFSGEHVAAKKIYIDNLTIKKPLEYAVGIDLAIFDASDQEYKYHFRGWNKRIHNESSLVYAGTNSSLSASVYEIGISEDPFYFYLDSTGSNISYANLKYYSYPIDERGDMLIPEHHLYAIMQFNYWMWQKRKGDNQAAIGMAKDDWKSARVEAKANNKIPSMLEGRDIARMHNSMIDKIMNYKY